MLFVPNDTFLNDAEDRVAIVTGPNMGKVHIHAADRPHLARPNGQLRPGKSATIGIVDRVFTCRGPSDDLPPPETPYGGDDGDGGHNKTRHAASLLILDKIGRGTSTYDGMAATGRAGILRNKRKLGAKTMFATHYHELSTLEGELPGVPAITA